MQQVSRENPCFRNDLSRGREAAASPVQESAGCSPGLDEHELLRYLSQSAVISQGPHPAQRGGPRMPSPTTCRPTTPASSSGSCSPALTRPPPPTASGRPSISRAPTSLRTTRRSAGSPGRPAGTSPPLSESPSPGVLQHPGWGGPGCLRQEVGTGVVTLLSTTLDDGLRNGIENSLTLTRQQQ